MIRIAFWIGDKSNPRATAVDRLVAWWTGRDCAEKRFSHVALVSCSFSNEADLIEAHLIEAHPRAGTVRRARAVLDPACWVVVEVGGNAANAVRYALAQVGRRYGYTEWLTFVLGFRVTAGGVTCSQLIAEALGLWDAWAHSPNSLFDACRALPGFRVLGANDLKGLYLARETGGV